MSEKTQPTEVRIPMPAETSGGLAGMIAQVRNAAPKAQAPATPATPSPAARTDAPRVPSSPGSEDRLRRSEPGDGRPSPSALPVAAQRPTEDTINPKPDSAAATNQQFELDERGQVVPAKDKFAAPEPKKDADEIDFEESETPEVKPEDRSDAKVEPEVKPAPEKSPDDPPLTFTQPAARDYSIFDPADVEALKKLPNAAFNRLSERFKVAKQNADELNKLKTEIASKPAEPTYLFEHPEAYMLQPEFTKLLQADDQAKQLASFYEEQLGRAQEGQDFQFVNDQGQLQTVALNGRVNGRAIAALTARMNMHIQQQQQTQLQIQQYSSNYKTQATRVSTELKAIEDKLFPSFDEAKLSPEEKAVYEYAYQITPAPLRSAPQTRLLAKAYVEFAKLHSTTSAKIASLEKQLAEATSKTPRPPTPGLPSSPTEDIIPFRDPED